MFKGSFYKQRSRKWMELRWEGRGRRWVYRRIYWRMMGLGKGLRLMVIRDVLGVWLMRRGVIENNEGWLIIRNSLILNIKNYKLT